MHVLDAAAQTVHAYPGGAESLAPRIGVSAGMRDGVADAYGIADNDKTKIRFTYDQERGRPHQYGVRIEVSPA